MSLSTLLDTIWFALRGNGAGVDFVVVYTALGALIWAFLLFKVFLQEGLQVAMGHTSELPRILVKYPLHRWHVRHLASAFRSSL